MIRPRGDENNNLAPKQRRGDGVADKMMLTIITKRRNRSTLFIVLVAKNNSFWHRYRIEVQYKQGT